MGKQNAISIQKEDEERLASFGYREELLRRWSLRHNFGISFSIISVVTGITTLFGYGLITGGPATMAIGWLVVSFFTLFVAMSMAEVVSATPTSGGPYFWAATLAPIEHAPFASWVTAWFNLLGQVTVTTGISFGLAELISNTATVMSSYDPSAGKTMGIYAAILASQGLLNMFGLRILRHLLYSSVALNLLGVVALAIAVLVKDPTYQPASFVFGTFIDDTGIDGAAGWSVRASPAYVACCGCLLAQYTLTGFDASAHLSEETRNASWSAPIGIVSSVGLSAVLGFFFLLALLFSIQDLDSLMASSYNQPVLQILVNIFGKDGALVLFCLIMACVWHCGLFSMASNSRMIFAFSRDGGLTHYFSKIDDRTVSPIRAVGLSIILALCLGLPSLGSSVAFTAVTSIATIGLYISYGIPIVLRLIYHRDFSVRKRPFDLGSASRPVAFIAVLWISFITIILCLPTVSPISSQTVNYAPVAVGTVFLGSVGAWLLWARNWFKGPSRARTLINPNGNVLKS